MNKIIRCHILDRQDDLRCAKERQKYYLKEVVKYGDAIEKAKTEMQIHMDKVEVNQKHIDYLESTMNIKWIENPPY